MKEFVGLSIGVHKHVMDKHGCGICSSINVPSIGNLVLVIEMLVMRRIII